MEERKSGLWWYLITTWFAFLLLYTFGKKLYMENVLEMPAIYISFWKLCFVVTLLAAFVRVRQQEKRIGSGLAILFGLLFLETVYCEGLMFFFFGEEHNFVREFWIMLFQRLLYSHGLAGVVGIILGSACARFLKSRIAYICVAVLAVSGVYFMDSYEYDVWNANPYNPYPMKEIFWWADNSYTKSHVANFSGPPLEDYDAATQNIKIKSQSMELWINQKKVLEASVKLELEPVDVKESFLRLNSIMEVDCVTDEDDNVLEWERRGHYLCIKGFYPKVYIHYYCDQPNLLAIDGDYVSLPAYVMYYPTGLEEKCDYQVVIHGKNTIYCNLAGTGKNVFEGQASTVSLLGGSMIEEVKINDVRIIYPTLRYESEEIKNWYKHMIVTRAQERLEGKHWFVDGVAEKHYKGFYRMDELENEDYIFG